MLPQGYAGTGTQTHTHGDRHTEEKTHTGTVTHRDRHTDRHTERGSVEWVLLLVELAELIIMYDRIVH